MKIPRLALPALLALMILLAPACRSSPRARATVSYTQTNRCVTSRGGLDKPLILAWPSADRLQLETHARSGVAVVRLRGCELLLLRQCRAPGAYRYSAASPKTESRTIVSAQQLRATLPIGGAYLEPKLAQRGELGVALTVVGELSATALPIRSGQLQGACEGATHVVAGLTVGAFALSAPGPPGSVAPEPLALDGNAAICAYSTSTDKMPRQGCSALLRLELQPLSRPLERPEELVPPIPVASGFTRLPWEKPPSSTGVAGSHCPSCQPGDLQCLKRCQAEPSPPSPPSKPSAPASPKKPQCKIVYEMKNSIEIPTRRCQ